MQKIKQIQNFWELCQIGDILLYSEHDDLSKPILSISNFYFICAKRNPEPILNEQSFEIEAFSGGKNVVTLSELIFQDFWWWHKHP